ncbi:ATP-dependent DNA helicase [Trichonephila clavipes]|nr:ATP-dependent DNA helicase [Trichonephila clavipes]
MVQKYEILQLWSFRTFLSLPYVSCLDTMRGDTMEYILDTMIVCGICRSAMPKSWTIPSGLVERHRPSPAECGKTFVIKLLMEIYNRYTNNDGYCHAYITCASTGKAAVAISGTTVHTALKISSSRLLTLHSESAQLPPVHSTPIYKQPKQTIVGPILWRDLNFYEVMPRANQQYSSILT